jgi:hypothetical protein
MNKNADLGSQLKLGCDAKAGQQRSKLHSPFWEERSWRHVAWNSGNDGKMNSYRVSFTQDSDSCWPTIWDYYWMTCFLWSRSALGSGIPSVVMMMKMWNDMKIFNPYGGAWNPQLLGPCTNLRSTTNHHEIIKNINKNSYEGFASISTHLTRDGKNSPLFWLHSSMRFKEMKQTQNKPQNRTPDVKYYHHISKIERKGSLDKEPPLVRTVNRDCQISKANTERRFWRERPIKWNQSDQLNTQRLTRVVLTNQP